MTAEYGNKVTLNHLQRNAYLYIRQSSIRQVVENTESTQRQYHLSQRAIALGWKEEQIHVIDSDLGQSAASTGRDGFKFLVSEVGLCQAGIVMGLEVSRLARNSSDWHRLLEICALTHTLILDEEGVYDPDDFNDRLVLGLKGTISEAELHVIRARLFGGMLNKAKRGELRLRPPVGYVYDAHAKLVKDPDKRVQAAINLFFETFRRVGTAGGMAKEFSRQQLTFPRRMFCGPNKGQVVFGSLTPSRANQILRNPRYAGAYAFGIRQQFSRGLDSKPLVKYVEPQQYKAFIQARHSGYISWEQYQENIQRLADNRKDTGVNRRCAAREGPALLQSLAVCGICGRHMSVRYHTRRGKLASPDYVCVHSNKTQHCQSVPGHGIDALIGKCVVQKISPASIEVAFAVQQQLEARIDEADRIRYQHVQNAEYEMQAAKGRYMMVDPQNRLVADELEANWNEKIRVFRQLQSEYECKKQQEQLRMTEQQKRKILELTGDFARLWNSDTTEDKDRKRMVRLIIEDVTLTKSERTIKVQIRYKGGATEEHELARPRSAWEEKRHSPEVLKEIDRLLDSHTDGEVANILNKKGYVSGTGKSFDARRVSVIRRAYRIRSLYTRLKRTGRYTIREICEKYGVGRDKVYEWRKSGKLVAYRYDDAGRYLYEVPEDGSFSQ